MNNTNSRLKEVKFEVTASCNQNCSFCANSNSFASNGRGSTPNLSTSRCLSIIDNAAASGVDEIRFTGGEPLLREDLNQLIKYAKLLGLKVKLNTNGSVFSKQSLQDACKYVDWVLFPLHALDAKGEQALTGNPRAFEKKLEAIKAFSNAGVFVAANTLSTAQNICGLEKFVQFSESLPVNYWFFNLMAPYKGSPVPEYNLQLPLLFEKIRALKNQGKIVRLGGTLPFCCYEDPKLVEESVFGAKECGCLQNLAVGPDASIRACCNDGLILGNALSDSLREVWENNETAKKFRNFEHVSDKCKKCWLLQKCGGGCRVYSKFFGGDYGALDPRAKPETLKRKNALNEC